MLYTFATGDDEVPAYAAEPAAYNMSRLSVACIFVHRPLGANLPQMYLLQTR
jgi:hypothetical protein